MKVLLDTCVAGRLVAPALVAAGHDAIWAGDWASDLILASFNCLTDTYNYTYNTVRYALHLA